MGVKKRKNGVPPMQNGSTKTFESNADFSDPFAVTWTEKYAKSIDDVWSKIPKFLATFLVTTSICIMGLGISGKCCDFVKVKIFELNKI